MSTVNPYRPPQEAMAQTPAMYAPSAYPALVPFQSLLGLATAVKALLGIVCVAKVAAIGATFALIVSLAGGNGLAATGVSATAIVLALTVLGAVFLSMITGVVYLVWLYRAYQNLPALGVTKLDASPGWAVGHYFIPFVNLVRPYQTIVEIMRGSFSREQQLTGKTSTAIAGWWWTGWILAAVLGQVSGAMVRGDEYDAGMLGVAAWVDVSMHTVSLLTAVLAMIIVHRISASQQRKHDEIMLQPPVAAPGYGQPFAPAAFPAGGNPFGEPPASGQASGPMDFNFK